MSTCKKYFWLKLKNDFFDREEIKLIEAMFNGKDYIIFYMKLLLKSIENDGKLFFRNTIPYSPEMLSSITNTNIDTVKISVDMFLKLGMMEKWDDGTLFMVETQNMIGNETKWAQYKRIDRQKKVEIGHCPNESKKISIELELKLEKDINIDDKTSLLLSPLKKEKRVDFKTFKKKLLESCPDFEFKLPYPNKLKYNKEHKGFKLKNGYIYDYYNDRLLNKDESFLAWDELYSIQERVFIAMKAQLSVKSAS